MQPASAEHIVRLIQALAQENLPDEMFARAVKRLVGAPRRLVDERKRRDLVRMKVKVGRAQTSVSVPRTALLLLAERVGGMAQARRHVRELANRAPADTTNRSGWLQDELAKELASLGQRD